MGLIISKALQGKVCSSNEEVPQFLNDMVG